MTARLATARWLAARPFLARSVAAGSLALSLAACQDGIGNPSARSLAPIPPQTLSLMQTKGMQQSDPILIRAYKKEAEMEVWKRGANGQYALLKTYPICRWSGQLGPKVKQGDRQAPEGFYTITPGLMNPNSSYYLSFDTGFPNAVDRANGRTGTYLMVHGTCSSAGCFAMTDASIAEIYAVAREAFAGGQRGFQFQSYPFRMTAQNMAKFRNDPSIGFWKNLKEGSDYFEALHEEPRVGQCGTRYVFGGADAAAGSCTPRVEPPVAEKRAQDEREVAELVARGTPAVRVVYQDGGQNPVFRPQNPSTFASLGGTETVLAFEPKEYAGRNLGDVSRPETLAAVPQEFEVGPKGRPVMLAGTEPAPVKGALKGAAQGTKAPETMPGGTAPATLMASRPAPTDTAAAPEKPARIAVADADGETVSYAKVLGRLFDREPKEPAKETTAAPAPAVDAASTAVKPAHAQAAATAAREPAKAHPVRAARVEATLDPRSEAKAGAKGEAARAAAPGVGKAAPRKAEP